MRAGQMAVALLLLALACVPARSRRLSVVQEGLAGAAAGSRPEFSATLELPDDTPSLHFDLAGTAIVMSRTLEESHHR